MGWDDDDKKGFSRRWGDEPEKGKETRQDDSVKLDGLIQRAQPLIEQVNGLYTLFANGVERLPPHEKRKQLEQLMIQIQNTPKPNQTYSFKSNSLQSHFVTLRDRWDRLIRDIESGKIKRPAGPKK